MKSQLTKSFAWLNINACMRKQLQCTWKRLHTMLAAWIAGSEPLWKIVRTSNDKGIPVPKFCFHIACPPRLKQGGAGLKCGSKTPWAGKV